MERDGSFRSWGGEPQQVYERLRCLVWDGSGETGDSEFDRFMEWGMAVFALESFQGSGGFWTVRRVRAPVRAGEFSVRQFFEGLGILRAPSKLHGEVSRREVCV